MLRVPDYLLHMFQPQAMSQLLVCGGQDRTTQIAEIPRGQPTFPQVMSRGSFPCSIAGELAAPWQVPDLFGPEGRSGRVGIGIQFARSNKQKAKSAPAKAWTDMLVASAGHFKASSFCHIQFDRIQLGMCQQSGCFKSKGGLGPGGTPLSMAFATQKEAHAIWRRIF